jgi:3-oxoacyl-[acyl-carrier-protein] synthase III
VTGVYLSAFASALGDQVRLEDADDEGVRRHLGPLHEQGLKYCLVSGRSVAGMAATSSYQTLAAAADGQVGAIVFCTDTVPALTPTSEAWDLLLELGLPRTPVTLVGGSGCGNLGPGLSVARSLILLDGLAAVLLVTSDRMGERTRYLDNGATVMSDGAASCLVSSLPPAAPSFALRGQASSFRADIGTVSVRRIVVARATVEAIENTVRQAAEPLSLTPADFRYLLTGNYGRTPRELLAESAGVPADRVYCPMLGQTGHCFAADVVVSLGSLLETGEIDNGDHVLLLTASPRSWSAAVLRFTLARC